MKQTLSLIALILIGGGLSAQNYRVETVRTHFEIPAPAGSAEFYQYIDDNVTQIELAAKHEKTANHPKMWYYRGLTYLELYLQGTELQNQNHPNALNIATESFYNAIQTDIKDEFKEKSEKALLNCAIGHYNEGVAQFKEQKYTDAIFSYDKVLKIIPLDKDGQLKRSNIVEEVVMQYSAYAAMAAENYEQAKKFLENLINKNFADPNIYVDMVRIYLIEKDTTGALKYVALGREMFENNVTLMEVELDLYLKQGRSKELIDKLNDAIALDGENKVYLFARAVTSMKLGNLDQAEADYKRVIEIDPGYADAYYNLGVVYTDRCKPLGEAYDKSTSFKEQNEIAAEIDEWYKKSANQFEEAMAIGNYSNADKLELAETLKKLYGRLMQNNPAYTSKYKEIKELITSLQQ